MATTRALGAAEADGYSESLAASDGGLLEAKPFAEGWRIWALRGGLLVLLLLLWEVAAGNPKRGEFALIDKFWVSQPSDIAGRLAEWISSGSLWFHFAITIQEMATGYVIGATVGITLGVLLARNRLLARLLDPFIMGIYSIPKLALAPLFILWFGVGLEPKIVLVATSVFFLVFLNTYAGVRDVDQELVDIIRLMGAGPREIFLRVILPSASPWIFTGLKLAVPYSLIGAIVGEIIASNKGLGYLLIHAQGQFDTAGVFAAIVVLMAFGLILNEVVNRSEGHLIRWKRAGRQHG